MMWWDNGTWGAGDWVAMSLMMVVVWGAIIVFVAWLIRSFRDHRDCTTDTAGPKQGADELLHGSGRK